MVRRTGPFSPERTQNGDASAEANSVQSQATSERENTSGGRIFSTLPSRPQTEISTRRSRMALTNAFAPARSGPPLSVITSTPI